MMSLDPTSTMFARRCATQCCTEPAKPTAVHLAPIDTAGGVGITGLHVANAAARAGARLLFVSQAAGRPELYRQAETLVSTGWAPAVIRIATGRPPTRLDGVPDSGHAAAEQGSFITSAISTTVRFWFWR